MYESQTDSRSDGSLKHIQSPSFNSNANSLCVLSVMKTSLKHLVHNCLQSKKNSLSKAIIAFILELIFQITYS